MTEVRRGVPPGLPWGLTLAVLVALGVLLTLGTWQVQRLHWKRDLLARIDALGAASAQPIAAVLPRVARGEDVDFTRVRATCPGIAAAPYLELYALRDGQAGSRLISACRLAGAAYGSVLLDRGYVADTISARPPVDPGSAAPLEIVGVLRRPDPANRFSPVNTPRRWYTRDIAAMAAALNAPRPAPLMLLAETATNPEWKALVPAPLPTEIPNRHLEYALTWYGLAAALLGVYAALLWKRRKS